MNEIFEEIGQKVREVALDLKKKTEDSVEIQRKKGQIGLLTRANERDIRDIGRMIYEKFQNGEAVDAEYLALCEAIFRREEEITRQKEVIQQIKEGY